MNCSECGSNRTGREPSGETFCKKCGKILEDIDVQEKEYRAYSAEEEDEKSRHGSSYKFSKPEKSLTTCVGDNSDVYSRVRPGKRSNFFRMRKWNKRNQNSIARRMDKPVRTGRELIKDLNLPRSYIEPVSRIYMKALENDLVNGRKAESMIAAAIYIVTRQRDNPRSLKNIASVSDVEKKVIGQDFKYLCRELDIQPERPGPEDYAAIYMSRLDLNSSIGDVRDVINSLEPEKFNGKSPVSVAAGAIYYTNKGDITQLEVARATGITEVTVRKNYREFEDVLGNPGEEE